ncbi:hypothetical protein ABFY53_01505 [Serratia nematodiphila]
MSPQRITLPAASARTQTLAEACIRKMTSASQKAGASRPSASTWTAQTLGELNASGDIWLIDGRRRAEPPISRYATAWPLWFGHQSERYEKPLFYFVNTPSVDMLRGLEPETNRKGIFISDADTGSADLPKGVQAWFPLQLTAMPAGCLSIRPMPEKPARYSITPCARSIWRERERWCISRPTQTMAPSLQGSRLSQNRRSGECIASPPRQTHRCRFVCAAPAVRSPAFSRRPRY